MKYTHLYNDYITTIEYKITYCTDKIYNFTRTKELLKDIIKQHRDYLADYNIDVNNLLNNPLIAYSKISDLHSKGHLLKVADYVKSFSNVVRLINFYQSTINKLRNCILPYEVYIVFLESINSEVARMVLEGEIVNYGRIGDIAIIEVPNDLGLTGTTKRVDWEHTNALKKQKQSQGIDLYNKELNPEGSKYFQYHANDYDYWWVWKARALTNRLFYKFMPNNYYHRFDSKHDQIKKYKDKESIYKDAVGNAEKMRFLLKFDPYQYINYRRNYEIIKVKTLNNNLQLTNTQYETSTI